MVSRPVDVWRMSQSLKISRPSEVTGWFSYWQVHGFTVIISTCQQLSAGVIRRGLTSLGHQQSSRQPRKSAPGTAWTTATNSLAYLQQLIIIRHNSCCCCCIWRCLRTVLLLDVALSCFFQLHLPGSGIRGRFFQFFIEMIDMYCVPVIWGPRPIQELSW